jgi:hypothetical protein
MMEFFVNFRTFPVNFTVIYEIFDGTAPQTTIAHNTIRNTRNMKIHLFLKSNLTQGLALVLKSLKIKQI